MLSMIAEKTDLSRAQVSEVFERPEGIMLGSDASEQCGRNSCSQAFQGGLTPVPARKAGTLIRNPATGK